MKHFRNFLAIWSCGLLSVFIIAELIEAMKAVIENAPSAFDFATDWVIVVIMMILAALVTVLILV